MYFELIKKYIKCALEKLFVQNFFFNILKLKRTEKSSQRQHFSEQTRLISKTSELKRLRQTVLAPKRSRAKTSRRQNIYVYFDIRLRPFPLQPIRRYIPHLCIRTQTFEFLHKYDTTFQILEHVE